MALSDFLDSAIATFAPVAGARRARARAQINAIREVEAAYDGASRSHRMRFHKVEPTSANAEISISLERLRNVSRDLRRNNSLAANCIAVIGSHVVGTGIVPNLPGEGLGKRVKTSVARLVRQHLESTAIDFDGRHDLYGLQRLVLDTVIESGEALVVRYMPPATVRLPIPLQVRVLDPDYLDTSKDGPGKDGGYCYQGIEVDVAGRRKGYWLYDEHPGGSLNWHLPQSRFVAARDVIHVYRPDRPGQMRGVPWVAPVIVPMRDLAEYEDAEIVRQKIAACFAVFFTGTPDQNIAQQAAAAAKSAVGNPINVLEPGLMKDLGNRDVKFATPPTVTGFADFVRTRQRSICAGFGVPYELATGDLGQVSFISGRLGLLQFDRNVGAWRWQMLIPHLCDGIGKWFFEAAQIVVGQKLTDLVFEWTPPAREMIEPSKEIPAARDAIRSGLSSRSEELRKRGLDPEAIDAENAADNDRADGLKLKFDSDGRTPANVAIGENGKPNGKEPPD